MAIKDHLNSDAFKQEVARVLPKHCTPERMVRTGLTALMKTPKLATCTPESFLNCMLQLSQWGLEPDGRHAHLIPYGDQCTLILDYKGIVDLVLRSGSVRTIHADVVHEGDLFDYSLGEVRAHTPHFLRTDAAKPDKAGKIIAVYCHVVFNDGGTKIGSDERRGSGKGAPVRPSWRQRSVERLVVRNGQEDRVSPGQQVAQAVG